VVDTSGSIAGPYCSLILAALGADVIKIEHPDRGDDIRRWGPPYWASESTSYLGMNAGKRSVALDLKRDPHRRLLHRLVAGTDVFLQAWRPGVAERLGADFETLRQLNPSIVYGSVSAFGGVGPLAESVHWSSTEAHRALRCLFSSRATTGQPVGR
jgi:crotonobetainyl-CoA:carnitine CoA-transferase CaiB-like acyl-CoA transferase